MNDALVRFRIQLWRLAHEDLMVFVCEEGWIRLWGLKCRHHGLRDRLLVLKTRRREVPKILRWNR
jgi:hypothetical protein